MFYGYKNLSDFYVVWLSENPKGESKYPFKMDRQKILIIRAFGAAKRLRRLLAPAVVPLEHYPVATTALGRKKKSAYLIA